MNEEKKQPKYYDEKAKDRTMKYLKEKRDKLTLNLPLGDKERFQSHAARRGKSFTKLITELIEADMRALEAEETKKDPSGDEPVEGQYLMYT